MTVRDLAVAIEVVPDISGVRSYKEYREERQKMFELICAKGREIGADEFVHNVALALSFPSRFATSAEAAEQAYASRGEENENIIRYLGENALYVIGVDNIQARKILESRRTTESSDLTYAFGKLAKQLGQVDLSSHPDLSARRDEVLGQVFDLLSEVRDRGI